MDPWFLPIQFFWKHCVSSIVPEPVSVAMVGVFSTPGASSPSAWHGTPARPARSRSSLSPYPAAAAYCFMCFWWSIPVLYWKNLHSVPLVYWLICTWSFHLGKSVQCRFRHKRCCEWALGRLIFFQHCFLNQKSIPNILNPNQKLFRIKRRIRLIILEFKLTHFILQAIAKVTWT
jgi:hypothetical protein